MPPFQLTLLCTATAALLTANSRAQAAMFPLPNFGVNGWIEPNASNPYVTTGNTERGLAFNPQTGNLLLVARQSVGGVSNNVRIVDGVTGADLGGLDNSGIAGGTFAVNMVGVDQGGAIYVGNLTTTPASNFKVYKWDSEATGVSTPSTVVFDALAGVDRAGDSFAVTGGTFVNPAQFAAAGSNATSASNFVVGSLDGLNTHTAYLSVPGTVTTANDYRLSLAFVDQDTLIGNQGATARLTSFDGVSATLDASIPLGGLTRRAMAYAVIGNTPVLAVIDTVSAQVTVLSLANPSAPVVLATANNTTGVLTADINGTGSVAWGPISGSTALLYAMSSNQGIQAFLVDMNPLATATDYGTGCDSLTLAANGLPSIGNSSFELSVGNVSPVLPLAFVAFGTLAINPGIDLTVIGMPGCNAYTSFDIGLFATAPVSGGIGSFPLAIPNDLNLNGATVAAQGVALSTATMLGLSASNGTALTFGF